MRPRPLFLLLNACLALAAVRVNAQTGPAEATSGVKAEVFFKAGEEAMAKKEYSMACPKLEEAVKLMPQGIGARMKLAECYEAAGKLAAAWGTYRRAEALASQQRDDRQLNAAERATELEPKLAKLTITVQPAAQMIAGLEVRHNGLPVPAAQWRLGVPVDKGRHVVVATAPGKQTWEEAFDVLDGLSYSTDIASLVDVAGTGWGAQRLAGAVVGAAGIVSLGFWTYLGASMLQKYDESNEGHCNRANTCDSVGIQLRTEAIVAGNTATMLLAVGGTALATGVVLFATAPKPAPNVSVKIAPGSIQMGASW